MKKIIICMLIVTMFLISTIVVKGNKENSDYHERKDKGNWQLQRKYNITQIFSSRICRRTGINSTAKGVIDFICEKCTNKPRNIVNYTRNAH